MSTATEAAPVRPLEDNIAFAFTTVEGRIHVQARYQRWGYRTGQVGPRKSRVYVAITEDEVPEARPPYGSQRGDDDDKAWRRYNRLEMKAMRRKLIGALDAVAAAAGQPGAVMGPFSFSRHAGCSCPCSPGFIADDMIRAGGPVDVWVS